MQSREKDIRLLRTIFAEYADAELNQLIVEARQSLNNACPEQSFVAPQIIAHTSSVRAQAPIKSVADEESLIFPNVPDIVSDEGDESALFRDGDEPRLPQLPIVVPTMSPAVFTKPSIIRALMGTNFFGVEEWKQYYDVQFPSVDIPQIPPFPWSIELLNSPCPFNPGKCIKDTHFAFLGLPTMHGVPLTVEQWFKIHPGPQQPKVYRVRDLRHRGQPHIDVTSMSLRWYLILKEIVPNSTDKTRAEQSAMLPETYELPMTIAETSKDLLVYKRVRIYCNSKRWTACAEHTVKTSSRAAGQVSCVGYFYEGGLSGSYWYGERDAYVGVGASRKVPA